MRKLFAPAVLLAAALASFGAQAQHPPQGEILLVNPPDGWKAEELQKSPKAVITRLLPPGQDAKTWTEQMMVQIYPGPDGQPLAYVDNAIRVSRENCEAAGASQPHQAQVNGYPYVSATISCTKGPSGMGSVLLIQGVRGKDALYIVQRQWRGKPFSKDEAPPVPAAVAQEWQAMRVGLCDTRDGQHACPK